MLLIRNNRRNTEVLVSLFKNHHKPLWHKTIETYFFTVLKVQSLKSISHLGCFYVSPEDFRDKSFPFGCGSFLMLLRLFPSCHHISYLPSSSFKGPLWLCLGPTQIIRGSSSHLRILNHISKVTFAILGNIFADSRD